MTYIFGGWYETAIYFDEYFKYARKAVITTLTYDLKLWNMWA